MAFPSQAQADVFEKPIKTKVFLQQFEGSKYLKGQKRRCITLYGVDADEVWTTVNEALIARFKPRKRGQKVKVE